MASKEEMKKDFIQKQKEKIQELRESSGSENLRENAIKKLNLMQDDLEIHGINITHDNIHLYYEFMSDEELLDNSLILITGYNGIDSRFNKVIEALNLSKDDCGAYNNTVLYGFTNGNPEFKLLNVSWGAFVLRYEIFGIKDTLKPIDEYIKEIKESKAYKSYIAKN